MVVNKEWDEILKSEYEKEYFGQLVEFIKKEYKETYILMLRISLML